MTRKGGLIGSFDPLRVSTAPRFVSAIDSSTQVIFSFLEPLDYHGDLSGYVVTAYPVSGGNSVGTSGGGSPITLTGLTNDTSYYVTVAATNEHGIGTPTAPYLIHPNSGRWYGTRGVAAGGSTGSNSNIIDYVTIASLGDATDFGDLATSGVVGDGATSSGSRGVIGARSDTATQMDYITIASTGDGADFGDLSVARNEVAASGNGVRGIFMAGDVNPSPYHSNVIDYITIASTGDATDYGDLGGVRSESAGTHGITRGLIAGGAGSSSNYLNIIEYITIASTGNSVDFGDLTYGTREKSGTSNQTRAIFVGGIGTSSVTYRNYVEFVEIASTGNGTDFGETALSQSYPAAFTDSCTAVLAGGRNGSNEYDIIQHIKIHSLGQFIDSAGDLTSARYGCAGLAGS